MAAAVGRPYQNIVPRNVWSFCGDDVVLLCSAGAEDACERIVRMV